MKYSFFALLFFSTTVNADCLFSWNASTSDNVTEYKIYKDNAVIKTLPELTTVLPCEIGTYSLTAVNEFGIESEKTPTITIDKPATPGNFAVQIQ